MTRDTSKSLQTVPDRDKLDLDLDKERLDRDGQGAAVNVDLRRRRILAAGASSSLLLSIASRPAWAQGGMCTASAVASANASGGYDFAGCGISAGWWKNNKDRWPIPPTTLFHSLFAYVEYENEGILYDGLTLGEVIDLNGNRDPVQGNFGFPLIGALLNATQFPPSPSTPGYAFTAQQVIDAYNALHEAAPALFQALAGTLDTANNQFDASTGKPEPW
ncbi:MAG: hypothetical protein R3F50_10590 [Gammaproteobacteria bacterium]